MKDPILLNNLWKEVEAGRVTANSSGSFTLFKYTQDTSIQDLWNDVNRQARGIIFDADGTVVARPFSKFFNLHERPETAPDRLPWNEGVEIYEKLDGSCGTAYRLDGRWRLATPGSMESDQAIEGTRMLNERKTIASRIMDSHAYSVSTYRLEALPTDCTPVFEIIYPGNRIVVDYHGTSKLVLLAIFDHNGLEWHPRRVDQIAERGGFSRPKRYDINLRDEIPFEENSEGYVCRFGNGLRVKVKSPTYVRIHRVLNRMSPRGVVELIRGHEYGTTVQQLPKEIAKDFDDIRALVQGMYNTIFTNAQDNIKDLYEGVGPDASRKSYATWVQENLIPREQGFVFALLDNKDIEDKIWSLVLERIKDGK